MAYDGRGHTPTLQIMLNNHQISKKDLHVLPQACSTASGIPICLYGIYLIHYIMIERNSHDL